jgi:hypothetical protein
LRGDVGGLARSGARSVSGGGPDDGMANNCRNSRKTQKRSQAS